MICVVRNGVVPEIYDFSSISWDSEHIIVEPKGYSYTLFIPGVDLDVYKDVINHLLLHSDKALDFFHGFKGYSHTYSFEEDEE